MKAQVLSLYALVALPALVARAQVPAHYELSGQSPLLANRKILLFETSRLTQPLDSAQADADGRFTLRGQVPGADMYLLRVDGEHQLDPVPLADQARLTAEFGKPTTVTKTYSLKLSGSAEAGLWQQVWNTDYSKLLSATPRPAADPMLRKFKALLRANASSSLAPYLTYHYLGRQPGARPLVDSLTTRFAREQPASPYLPRLHALLSASQRLAVGAVAPDFTLPGVGGKLIALSSLRGKYVLVDFWASWCQPCRAENPAVLAAYQRYRSRGVGFTVLSVSLDEKEADWRRAVAQDALPWAQVADLAGFQGRTGQLYNVQAIPATFLLDPQGRILATDLHGAALANELGHLLR